MNSSMFLTPWGQQLMKKIVKPIQKYKPKSVIGRWNIVRGDQVQVVNGPQTDQKGTVIKVLRDKQRLIVDGVNIRRRIVKPKSDGSPGKIISMPCSIHYSNVMLIDPTTG